MMDSLSGAFLKLGSALRPCIRLCPRRLIAVSSLILGVAQISCADALGPGDIASVDLGSTKVWLAVGDTAGFAATPRDVTGAGLWDRGVTWKSSNSSVASVTSIALQGAAVVATGIGVADITATSGGRSASVTIMTVPYRLAVFSINIQNPIIALGNKFAYAVTMLDTQGNLFPAKVLWRSDNPSAVTVDADGRLTGVSVGSAYIFMGFNEPLTSSQYVQVVQQVQMGTLASLTANYRTACSVNSAGAAFCWGDGTEGQLANGDLVLGPPVGLGKSAMIPVPLPGGLTFSAVSPTVTHSCGLSTTGAAYCWGSDDAGQLGDNRAAPQQVRPVAVAGGHTFTTIGTNAHYTCALDDTGAAYCWGYNQWEVVAKGTFVSSKVPVALPGGLVFASLSAGVMHACGITTTGATYCWGRNDSGELGDGSTVSQSSPVVVGGGASFVQVSAGEQATCGLTSGGAAYCWGANASGQLGDGTTTSHASPAPVSGSLVFTSISLGNDHACAVQSGGAAYCWGDNTQGELGNGAKVSSLVPVKVSGGLVFSSVQAGLGSSCGLTTNKVVYCWGRSDFGQLGDGTGAQSSVPVKVAGQP
jgi:alpha-tubulin suppressor-like RCC1 family protein